MTLHTEQEARKLWCPMARVGHQVPLATGDALIQIGCNRLGASFEPLCRCIASECAMWEWKPREEVLPDIPKGQCGLKGRF